MTTNPEPLEEVEIIEKIDSSQPRENSIIANDRSLPVANSRVENSLLTSDKKSLLPLIDRDLEVNIGMEMISQIDSSAPPKIYKSGPPSQQVQPKEAKADSSSNKSSQRGSNG